ncbi:tRNA epoxyqueuosine(34) reductase QueG [Coprobacter sp.]
MNVFSLKDKIFKQAYSLGFSACGITSVKEVNEVCRSHFDKWLQEGKDAQMQYMRNYKDKRFDPHLLVEDARSILVVALNYYPRIRITESHPQFALYAYGQDYHTIIKEKLNELFSFINTLIPINGKIFCDTAPVMERYWAQQAGIGFIGKNTQLIIPGKGSFFFLGEIISSLELPWDIPMQNKCGHCKRCIEQCPTQALISGDFTTLDSNKCISYQTIENKAAIPFKIASKINNKVYGCDTCQKVCPWNKFSTPTTVPEFEPSEEFLSLDREKLKNMTHEDFNRIFKKSAVKRAKYEGLMRNINILSKNKSES